MKAFIQVAILHQARPAIARMVVVLICICLAAPAHAVRIRNICRVKGQEQNTLQGLGLVVGLKGTGDGPAFGPKIQALANALHRLGSPLGPAGLAEIKNAKNVALVMITATISESGGRQGDLLNCVVNSIGEAKSLDGGYLMPTPLMGPFVAAQAGKSPVYGFAQGPLYLDDENQPNRAKITQGARLEQEFLNPFLKGRQFTLVVKESHASFSVAHEIAEVINQRALYTDSVQPGDQFRTRQSREYDTAKALDQKNVLVTVPPEYEDPIYFITFILDLPLTDVNTEARVTVNRDTGLIVIHGNVEVGPAVVNHRNVVIEAGNNVPVADFIPIDSTGRTPASLDALVAALRAVRLPPRDIIDVIVGLERNGNLHGTLIVE